MEAPKYQKSDPAILLLNEIDILLAQTRLMELYLKQAQATAANEQARIHEQYESTLATLRAELADKEKQLQQRPVRPVEADLNAAVEQLQRELSEKQRWISSNEAAFQRSNSEVDALQQRIAQLQAENSTASNTARESDRIRESLAADVAALNLELERNRREFHQQQLAAQELEQVMREQLRVLQNQIAEKQAYALNSDDQLRVAQQEIAALRQHLGSLQSLQDELQSSAARELEQTRGRFELELSSLHSALADRERSAAQSQAALVEIEHGLKSEIATLRSELEQKQAALLQRDDDVRAAGSQIAALQQRVGELELAHRQAAAATAAIDGVRRSLAEEVANLQHEVAVKEKELVNRYEAVTAVELALHGRIQALQQELARAHETANANDAELENQRAGSAALQGRIVELERAQADSRLLDVARQQLESDLNRLRADLAQKEYLLGERERTIGDLEARLGAEIATLHQQLAEERGTTASIRDEVLQARNQLTASRARLEAELKLKDDEVDHLRTSAAAQNEQLARQVNDLQRQLTEREGDLASLESRRGEEIAALHQQLAQERSMAAQAHEELTRYQAEITATQARIEYQLREKAAEVDSLRASAVSQTEQLSKQVNELQLQLAEKQLLADSRASELDHLRAAVSQLNEQLNEKTANHAQAVGLLQSTHAQYSDELGQLAAARDQLQRSHTALEVQLDQARSANATLRSELQDAKNQSAEVAATLQSSHAAMAVVEADRVRLKHDLEETEAQLNKARVDGASELAQVRETLESEIATLRGELQQKAWSLAQQQASVENLAQVHREQIRRLEARLNDPQPLSEQQTRELEHAVSRANSLQVQVEELQSALQQAQASAISQAEQIRQEFAAQLESTSSLLAAKSAEIINSGAVRANIEESLRAEISRLRQEMQSRTATLQSREEELDRVRAEMTSVQNRIVQLESVTARTESEAREISQAKNSLESDLTALRQELQHKSTAVAQQQTSMEELANRHRSQVEQLEANLSEQQRASEERRRDADQAQAQIALLQSRVEELQSALQQTELSANSRAEQLRQDYQARVNALSRELAENATQLQASAAIDADIEPTLRGEIDRLLNEAQERNQILQDRNDELVRVKNDLDSLAERFTQLEANAIHSESRTSSEAERMRTEYQAQLALLQAELSQKEWALEERQAIIAGLEQEHRQQLDTLRQQLTAKESSAPPAAGAFVLGDPNLTDAQREKLNKLDDLESDLRNGNALSNSLLSRRRWSTGFGSKRRWRS